MKVQRIVTEIIHLELTTDEARWLHAVMQNPIDGSPVDIEVGLDREMRRKFFEATHTTF